MRKILLITALLISSLIAGAQSFRPQDKAPLDGMLKKGRTVGVDRKFNILFLYENDSTKIRSVNTNLRKMENTIHDEAGRGIFALALKNAFSTAALNKTTGITGSILNYTIAAIKDATKSPRASWHNTAQQQCSFKRVISSAEYKDDFYALPSLKGAFDPENMKFKGFGLNHYIEEQNNPGHGRNVLTLECVVKKDDEGLRSIINHGKFLIDIDKLEFEPAYCGLPNDSNTVEMTKFDFEKRDNLALQIKVKVFSSWFNEAIMLQKDQELGQFIITAKIDPEMLDENGVFIYDSSDPRHRELVTTTGDCFMVPRSFTGTPDGAGFERTWGTGEFRIEMELAETCNIVDSYYQKHDLDSKGPKKVKWDKEKWGPEWKAMKALRKKKPFFQGLWESIVIGARGTGWVETFTDPLKTAILTTESMALTKALNLPATQSAGAAGAAGAGASTPGKNPANPAGAGGAPKQ